MSPCLSLATFADSLTTTSLFSHPQGTDKTKGVTNIFYSGENQAHPKLSPSWERHGRKSLQPSILWETLGESFVDPNLGSASFSGRAAIALCGCQWESHRDTLGLFLNFIPMPVFPTCYQTLTTQTQNTNSGAGNRVLILCVRLPLAQVGPFMGPAWEQVPLIDHLKFLFLISTNLTLP